MVGKLWVKRSLRGAAVVAGVAAMAVVGLPGATQAAPSHARHHAKASATEYYVALGDSYSVGYQPNVADPTTIGKATKGYTGAVAADTKMTQEDFGCGGATTSSILSYTGVCAVDPTTGEYGPPALVVPTETKGDTQVQNAVAFITAHKGHIGLITVSIGGNDVTACASASNPVSCVAAVTGTITTNVTNLVGQLSSAAGAGVPIIGTTYPDVILGEWVCDSTTGKAPCLSGSPDQSLAKLSVTAFQDYINPALLKAYTSVSGGGFVDVTTDTGYLTPLTDLTTLAPYGKIPVAVADVCKLTYYCSLANIHANNTGYADIGKYVDAEYKTLAG